MSFYRKRKAAAADFNNRPVNSLCFYGFSHRSKLERAICDQIRLRELAGEIVHEQHEEHLAVCGPPGHECPKKREYVADFRCRDKKTGEPFWVEAKGFANERWPTTKALWRHYGPGRLEIWMGDHRRPTLAEILPRGILLP